MVFESAVIKVLHKYIGKYLKNFDANNLSIGLWSGMIHIRDVLEFWSHSEAYSEPSCTSLMVLFAKIVDGSKLLIIFAKSSILDNWLCSAFVRGR